MKLGHTLGYEETTDHTGGKNTGGGGGEEGLNQGQHLQTDLDRSITAD